MARNLQVYVISLSLGPASRGSPYQFRNERTLLCFLSLSICHSFYPSLLCFFPSIPRRWTTLTPITQTAAPRSLEESSRRLVWSLFTALRPRRITPARSVVINSFHLVKLLHSPNASSRHFGHAAPFVSSKAAVYLVLDSLISVQLVRALSSTTTPAPVRHISCLGSCSLCLARYLPLIPYAPDSAFRLRDSILSAPPRLVPYATHFPSLPLPLPFPPFTHRTLPLTASAVDTGSPCT